jgi:hypothetical protein
MENPMVEPCSVPEASRIVVSPNDFPGDAPTVRIANALAFLRAQGGGTLELGVDHVNVPATNIWTITESIVLPSFTTLFLNRSRLKLADGVFDTMIRNEGIVVDPADPNGLARELRRDRGIRIIGSGVDSAAIEGPDVPFAAPHPVAGGAAIPWVGDFYGWRTVSILLANCADYEIGGFSISKTTCWAISQEHGCENMYLHDLAFETTVKNGDGIDFRKGCRHGRVERITGACADDVVACTALLGHNHFPQGKYVFPMQVGGNARHALGDDIEDIGLKHIHAASKCHVVICLAAGGAKLRNITAADIEDGPAFAAINVVAVYTGYGEPARPGDLRDLRMRRIVSRGAGSALKIHAPLLDCAFDELEQHNPAGVLCEILPPYDRQLVNVNIS